MLRNLSQQYRYRLFQLRQKGAVLEGRSLRIWVTVLSIKKKKKKKVPDLVRIAQESFDNSNPHCSSHGCRRKKSGQPDRGRKVRRPLSFFDIFF